MDFLPATTALSFVPGGETGRKKKPNSRRWKIKPLVFARILKFIWDFSSFTELHESVLWWTCVTLGGPRGGEGPLLRWSLATWLIQYITCKSALGKDGPGFFDQCELSMASVSGGQADGCMWHMWNVVQEHFILFIRMFHSRVVLQVVLSLTGALGLFKSPNESKLSQRRWECVRHRPCLIHTVTVIQRWILDSWIL